MLIVRNSATAAPIAHRNATADIVATVAVLIMRDVWRMLSISRTSQIAPISRAIPTVSCTTTTAINALVNRCVNIVPTPVSANRKAPYQCVVRF